MPPITHLLFVVISYCKQFQQQSGTSDWSGSVTKEDGNLHPDKVLISSQDGFQIGTDAH